MFESIKSLEKVISLVESGFEGHEQGEGKTEYKRRGPPFEGKIKEEWTREKKERFIRAMTYPPRPPAEFNGEEIRKIEDLD